MEKARDTDCIGCPDVCHGNHTSLFTAVGLRSLRVGGGSSYFGWAEPESRRFSFSAPTSVHSLKWRCPTWTHGSSEGPAVVMPMLPTSTHRHPSQCGLHLPPACPAVVTANCWGRGWQRDEKRLICIPVVRRVGKVTRRCPSMTRRARYLLSPPELPWLQRYKIFSNKKKLDHLPGGATTFIPMSMKDGFDHGSSHTSLIADGKPTSTQSQHVYRSLSSHQAGCQANQFDLTDVN